VSKYVRISWFVKHVFYQRFFLLRNYNRLIIFIFLLPLIFFVFLLINLEKILFCNNPDNDLLNCHRLIFVRMHFLIMIQRAKILDYHLMDGHFIQSFRKGKLLIKGKVLEPVFPPLISSSAYCLPSSVTLKIISLIFRFKAHAVLQKYQISLHDSIYLV
jgi:hypothetical protein